MALLLAALTVLIPLIITPGLLFYYDVTPKVTILLIGTTLAMMGITGNRLPRGSETMRRGQPVKSAGIHQAATASGRLLHWFRLLLGIQAISLCVSTANSGHWQLSLIGTNWRRFGLLTHL